MVQNGFKINAHTKVARVLEDLVEDIATVDNLKKLPGVGKSSESKIKEFLETGKIKRTQRFASIYSKRVT